MKLLRSAALAASLAMASVPASATPSDILFVLDGSGSMWGQIDGVSKIQTAKETMQSLMDDVPSEARLGLMTYGTQSKSSCSDVTVLNTIGAPREQIKASIDTITPLGKTPIGTSLAQALSALEKSEPSDIRKSLVLISDGIETCESDPCAIAKRAQESGIDMKVHVVGFDVDDAARAQLQCIAKNGNGQYFNASDTKGFKDAMAQVVKVSQAEEKPTGPIEVFRDDFDGDRLAEHWTVYNEDLNSYIVENGQLTIISAEVLPFGDETASNRFDLNQPLPSGDWDVEIAFNIDHQDAPQEALYLGDIISPNSIYGFFATGVGRGDVRPAVFSIRQSPNKAPVSQGIQVMTGLESLTFSGLDKAKKHVLNDQVLTMTWSKRGRDYTTSLNFVSGKGDPVVRITDPVTQLRGPKNLSMLFSLYRGLNKTEKAGGDSTVTIDHISIRSIKK